MQQSSPRCDSGMEKQQKSEIEGSQIKLEYQQAQKCMEAHIVVNRDPPVNIRCQISSDIVGNQLNQYLIQFPIINIMTVSQLSNFLIFNPDIQFHIPISLNKYAPIITINLKNKIKNSMANLQSQDNPLRTLKQFYRPSLRQQANRARRNFPQIHSRGNSLSTLDPIPLKSREALSYIDGLEKAKNIHRSFYHNAEYYPDPPKDRKMNLEMYHNKKFKAQKCKMKDSAFRTINDEKKSFMRTFVQKQQKKQELNTTFYNTNKKKKLYMQKFHDWQSLTERSSPTYQNMLNRNLIEEHIFKSVKKAQHKFIHGF